MNPSWHRTDSDDWEHVLPPDSLPSIKSSLVVNHTSGRHTSSELEKEILSFDFMCDNTQTTLSRHTPVIYPADITDPFRNAVPKSRTAHLLDAAIGPWTKVGVNSSVGRTNVGKTEKLYHQWYEEPLTTIDVGLEQPTSPDTAHCHNPDFQVSNTPILSDGRNTPKSQPVPIGTENPQHDQRFPDLLLQPDSRPITQQQPAAEVNSIYAGLTVVHNDLVFDACAYVGAVADMNETLKPGPVKDLKVMKRWNSSPAMASVVIGDLNTDTAKSFAPMKKRIMTYTDLMKERLDHVIPGILDSQYTVDATGDTGAKYNFLNEVFAKRCKFKIDSTLRRSITIASGQKVMTTGIAEVSFCFQGEQTSYPLKFHVLSGCVKNVILGKSFLKATKTFSNALNFAKRVVKRFTRTLTIHQVLYLGASPPMFAGLLNGEAKMALADSASKVLLMDEDYARALGVSIVSTKETRIKLRLADGSTAFTSGKTYNVSWQFGTGKRYPLDFYILKNAPADVILSEDFLLRESKAFIKYADCLIEEDEDSDFGYYDDSDDDDYFFAIYRDDHYHPQAYTEGADEYFEDDREDARRIEEDLHIISLYGAEKDAAIARAKARREQWAAKQAANRLAQRRQNNTTNTASSSAAPQPQTNNVAGVPSASKCQRWLHKLVKKRKSGKAGRILSPVTKYVPWLNVNDFHETKRNMPKV